MKLREAIDEAQHWTMSAGYEFTGRTRDGRIKTKALSPQNHQTLWLAILKEQKGPYVYVNRKGEVFFNETAKKYAIESEVRDAIELLLGFRFLPDPPLSICLTNSLRELAEMAPDTRVFHLEGAVYPCEMK